MLAPNSVANFSTDLSSAPMFSISDAYKIDFKEQEEVKARLNKIADKYSSDKVVFHFKKLYAEATLLSHLQDDIQKSRPSIIAMFTKQNRNWFERFFLSSKTAELGFDTKTPMLVFRK